MRGRDEICVVVVLPWDKCELHLYRVISHPGTNVRFSHLYRGIRRPGTNVPSPGRIGAPPFHPVQMPSFVLGAKIPGTNEKPAQGQLSDSLLVKEMITTS
jgi:hypothetical protein